MAVESQFDAWRKDVLANIRKAAEAAREGSVDRETGKSDEVGMALSYRFKLALAAAEVTSNIMIAERLGQLTTGLLHQDEAMAELQQRTRSGEQILGRLLELIEAEGYDLSEDGETMLAMAEDWLAPEGVVTFATPEAVEVGADSFSDDAVESEDLPEEPEPS